METSMLFDSKARKLQLFAKENFVNDDNFVLTVCGTLDTSDGGVVGKAALRKKFFPGFLTMMDVGASYKISTKRGKGDDDELIYGASAKKSFELADDGLLSVDLKGGCNFNTAKKSGNILGGAGHLHGSVELCQKIFNFTEDQDLKLKLGYQIENKTAFAQIRENNWTLNCNLTGEHRGRWDISYDL